MLRTTPEPEDRHQQKQSRGSSERKIVHFSCCKENSTELLSHSYQTQLLTSMTPDQPTKRTKRNTLNHLQSHLLFTFIQGNRPKLDCEDYNKQAKIASKDLGFPVVASNIHKARRALGLGAHKIAQSQDGALLRELKKLVKKFSA